MVSLGPAPTISSPPLCAGTDVYRQFGLRHPLVVQLLEQLPNSEKCSGYHFTYHHPEKLSSWQATVSFFMACLTVSLHFPTAHPSITPLFPPLSFPPSSLFILSPTFSPPLLLLPPLLPPPRSPSSFLPFREQHSTPVAALGVSHFVGKSLLLLSLR